MTESPDWQPTFDAVAKIPGSKVQQPQRKTWADRVREVQAQRKLAKTDIAVGLGAFDGPGFDPDGWLFDYSTGIENNFSGTWSTIVENLLGWTGLFGLGAAGEALNDTAATIANLAAAITALQNNQNNQNVGGQSAIVDFPLRADSNSLGADFTQSYMWSGTGLWGISSGLATWLPVNDGSRFCTAIYNAVQTTTDYQQVGAAFGSAPRYVNSTAQARNRLIGRSNAAGTTYVYADFGKNDVELGCVVSGATTVLATKTSGFSFKSNGVYWLRCGQVGSLRIFQVLEGNTILINHAEVGTTSQVGASYRYCGMAVQAYVSVFGTSTLPPGRVAAFAFSDNQPPTVFGSSAHMYRTNTATFNVSSGTNVMPNDTFNVPGEHSDDITMNTTTGAFTVSIAGQYQVEAHLKLGSDIPSQLQLRAYVNGTADRAMGPPMMRGLNAGGSPQVPNWGYGAVSLQLEAGDVVQLGYTASSGTIGGAVTGEVSGLETFFTISLQSRSLA